MSRQSQNTLKKKAAFKRLEELHQKSEARDLIWHYDVGQQVQELHPSDSRRYGTSELETIAESLGQKASYADKLVKARKFSKIFGHPRIKALNGPNPDTGFVLSWSHMEALLPLDDKDREKLLSLCIDKEWSTRELKRTIDGYRKRRDRGGRKFQKPADLETALRQLIDESSQWHRRFHEVWFAADDPAIDVAGRKRLPKATRELMDGAIDALQNMQHDIDQSLEILLAARKAKK